MISVQSIALQLRFLQRVEENSSEHNSKTFCQCPSICLRRSSKRVGLEVPGTSKETRNLYQRAFVRLRFVSEPTVQSDAGNAELGSGPAFAIFGFTEVAFQGKKYVSRINAPVCSRTLRVMFDVVVRAAQVASVILHLSKSLFFTAYLDWSSIPDPNGARTRRPGRRKVPGRDGARPRRVSAPASEKVSSAESPKILTLLIVPSFC